MLQQVLAIFLVLALLGSALWFLQSRGVARYRGLIRHKSGRQLECLARLTLTPHHSVHLVRISDHTVLLALSPSGCTLLERAECPRATEKSAAEPEAALSHSGAAE